MTIVHINSTYGTGSIGRLSLQLAEYATAKGYKSYYYFADGPKVLNKYKIGTKIETLLHAFMSRLTGKQGYYSFFATKRLIKELKSIKPNLIHLHNLHSNYINIPMLIDYIAKEKIGLIITLHDCWFFTGKCVHPIFANCNKFESKCGNCPQLKSDKINPTFFFDTSFKCQQDKKKWFDSIDDSKLCIVGVSKWITAEAQKSYVFKNRPFKTIYNWIDDTQFNFHYDYLVKKKYEIPENKYVVLMVSSKLGVNKGYKEMCDLSMSLDDKYQIVYVGDPKNLSIPPNVIHIDKINSSKDLSKIYSIADVCLNLTNGESFGMVTIEAMSCGTPVVVYNNTASPELVGENCGIIVNKDDGVLAIKKAISVICNNGKDYYKQFCIDFVRHNFSKEGSLNDYLITYRELSETT